MFLFTSEDNIIKEIAKTKHTPEGKIILILNHRGPIFPKQNGNAAT
jgi:hypothetical protein